MGRTGARAPDQPVRILRTPGADTSVRKHGVQWRWSHCRQCLFQNTNSSERRTFQKERWFVVFPGGEFGWQGISNAEARQPGKAPNFSVNWTVGDSTLEVINATTGKDELGRASRLCKHALYSRWMRVHGKVPSNLLRSKITKPNVYHESKLAAKEYQAAKACLLRAFIKAGLGAWVEKPTEQDQFSLTP